MVGTQKIDAEHLFHLRRIRFVAFQVSMSRYSGAIHQDIDRWKLPENMEYFFPISHVTNHRDEILPQDGLHFLQWRVVDVDTPHHCVQVYETCAKSATESRCRPGDDDILRLPVLVHGSKPGLQIQPPRKNSDIESMVPQWFPRQRHENPQLAVP